MRVFAFFNLKAGVSVEDYEAWARGTDLPTVNGLESVRAFRVFKVTGLLGGEGAAPFGYVETIDIDDIEGFWRDVGTPKMQEIAAAFGGMVDVTFMTTTEILAAP
jgi:hypothetical protein